MLHKALLMLAVLLLRDPGNLRSGEGSEALVFQPVSGMGPDTTKGEVVTGTIVFLSVASVAVHI
jgi:hypothetical protein